MNRHNDPRTNNGEKAELLEKQGYGESSMLSSEWERCRNYPPSRGAVPLAAAGILSPKALEFSSIEAIKQCAMLGMGVALVPAVSVAAEVASGRLAALPWLQRDFRMVTQIIWHKEKWLSPALQAFLTVTREVFKDAEKSGI